MVKYTQKQRKEVFSTMMGKSHLTVNGCVLAQAAAILRLDACAPAREYIQAALGATDIPSALGAAAICIPLFLLGGILPDIDSPNSILGRKAHLPVTHHGITHTLWAALALLALCFMKTPLIFLGLGYLFHLLADSLGAQGVAWFYPLTGYREYGGGAKVKKGHRIKLYRTGQMSETVCVMAVIAITISMAVITLIWQKPW